MWAGAAGGGGGESLQLGRVRATAASRVHDSIDRDDGMKEIDPDEHLETLGSGIPQHLGGNSLLSTQAYF